MFEVEWHFMAELIVRTAIMFLMILLVLRLSGRRGVRQLTLFEVAIILGLGSAAGDPMFQPEIPVLHALVVLVSVVVCSKATTWAAARFDPFTTALEGDAKEIIRDGMFDVENERNQMFSQQEFFAELRNQNVEHLGQVRIGLLEVDGTISLLFYPDEDTKFGLPLFPDHYRAMNAGTDHFVACM